MTALKARAAKAGQMGKARKPPISAVRFTEGSVDAPTPPVNLYNQKSHVLSSARSVPCWNLGDVVSNQTRIAIGFLEPAV